LPIFGFLFTISGQEISNLENIPSIPRSWEVVRPTSDQILVGVAYFQK
jgi:hypothetical protein